MFYTKVRNGSQIDEISLKLGKYDATESYEGGIQGTVNGIDYFPIRPGVGHRIANIKETPCVYLWG